MSETVELDLESLPHFIRVIFIATGQAAVIAKQNDLPKEVFIRFCSQMWETVDLNGMDKFSALITERMRAEIDDAFGEELGEKLRREYEQKTRTKYHTT